MFELESMMEHTQINHFYVLVQMMNKVLIRFKIATPSKGWAEPNEPGCVAFVAFDALLHAALQVMLYLHTPQDSK